MEGAVNFVLNGRSVRISVDAERSLLWVLRSDLGLTGAKYGCGEGHCGACTVLVNNEAVKSCQTSIREVEGKKVLTVEGLSLNKRLHPIQKAFAENNAVQCGYCTPGMIMTAYSLLMSNPKPTQEEIVNGMEDNLCRCSSYSHIIQAIQSAAGQIKGDR